MCKSDFNVAVCVYYGEVMLFFSVSLPHTHEISEKEERKGRQRIWIILMMMVMMIIMMIVAEEEEEKEEQGEENNTQTTSPPKP
uniref:Transmembrane protein n=1 Tax=Octopus bimaculoides TaxID=37653 RepID=A0A0L8GQG9_OCTBM